jgi:hypothetical protein
MKNGDEDRRALVVEDLMLVAEEDSIRVPVVVVVKDGTIKAVVVPVVVVQDGIKVDPAVVPAGIIKAVVVVKDGTIKVVVAVAKDGIKVVVAVKDGIKVVAVVKDGIKVVAVVKDGIKVVAVVKDGIKVVAVVAQDGVNRDKIIGVGIRDVHGVMVVVVVINGDMDKDGIMLTDGTTALTASLQDY